MIAKILAFFLCLAGPGRPARSPGRTDRRRGDGGVATAEYAVLIVVACTFALVMFGIIRSAAVRDLLTGMVRRALTLPA